MNAALHISQSDWLDLGQADREGPFSKRTIWTLISTGQLPAYRPLKKKILIKRSDLNKLIEARRVGADLDAIVDEVVAKELDVNTVIQATELHKNDPVAEQECGDSLLRHKGTDGLPPLQLAQWSGHRSVSGGRRQDDI